MKLLFMATLTGSMASLFLILLKTRLVKKFGGVSYYHMCLLALALFVLPIQVDISGFMPQRVVIEERLPVPQTAVNDETTAAIAETIPAAAARMAAHHHLPVLTLEQCIWGIWMLGFIFMIGRYLSGYFRFKRKVVQNKPIHKAENLDIVISAYVHSPMLIGFIKPKIVIPDVEISEHDYRLALRHELIHYRQKDAWFKLFTVLINSLHWFNPVTYWVVENINEACEYACDEKVTQGMGLNEKKRYSDMILNFAAHSSPALSSSLAQNKNRLFRRFDFIMKTNTGNKSFLGAMLAAVIIAGSVTATSLVFAEDLKPLSEYGGGIVTYYNPYETLEDNVLNTLGIHPDTDVPRVYVMHGTTYIDVNGRKIDYYNRTEPYYGVDWEWKENSTAIEKMIHQTLFIEGKTVTIAFADHAAAFQDDKVIAKMIINQISYELSYRSKTYDYNHQAFINELISRGAYVIKDVVTPENFKLHSWQKPSGDFLGMKLLTKYDKKDKLADIFNQKTTIPKDLDGHQGVQIGNSFVIKNQETLAIDIKETTDKMPTVNWAIVDVTTGELIDWMPGARGGYRFTYTPGEIYINHTFKIVMSGEEADSAYIEIFTYQTEDKTASMTF